MNSNLVFARGSGPLALAAAVVVLMTGGCEMDLPQSPDDGRAHGQPEVVQVRHRAPPPRVATTRSGSGRGAWQHRLWIGLWCEARPGAAASDPYRVFVDEVEMLVVPATCGRGGEGVQRPTGGATSFTLAAGGHRVRVVAPNGQVGETQHAVSTATWLSIVHRPEADPPDTAFSFEWSADAHPADVEYRFEAEGGATGSRRTVQISDSTGDDTDDEAAETSDGNTSSSGEPREARRPSRERAADGQNSRGSGGSAQGDGATGSLTVQSTVPVAIWINGRDSGLTAPVSNVELPVGSHRIVLREADGRERSFSVDIEQGRSRTLVHAPR